VGRGGPYDPGMNRKRRRRPRADDEGSYVCPSCGESIVVPLDPTQGADQQYVEDCPVCCNPNVIRVEYDPAWDAPRVSAEAE
jgi:ribosomal protein L37AE/L43A